MSAKLIGENPVRILLVSNRQREQAPIRASFVFFIARIVMYVVSETITIKPSTMKRELGGTVKRIMTINVHKIRGRNRYCIFIYDLL